VAKSIIDEKVLTEEGSDIKITACTVDDTTRKSLNVGDVKIPPIYNEIENYLSGGLKSKTTTTYKSTTFDFGISSAAHPLYLFDFRQEGKTVCRSRFDVAKRMFIDTIPDVIPRNELNEYAFKACNEYMNLSSSLKTLKNLLPKKNLTPVQKVLNFFDSTFGRCLLFAWFVLCGIYTGCVLGAMPECVPGRRPIPQLVCDKGGHWVVTEKSWNE